MPVVGDDEDQRARGAIDTLARLLNGASFLNVDRVVKGGSLGRRTMVTGSFDVDLAVFINNMTYPDDWDDAGLLSLLGQLRRYLNAKGYKATVSTAGAHYDDVLQVTVDGVPVDVLLVPNMCRKGPQRDRAVQQRKALMDPVLDDPELYDTRDKTREVAVAESLTDLVANGFHDTVKAVVRLLKAWYKYGLQDALYGDQYEQYGKVPSIALELLVEAASSEIEDRLLCSFSSSQPPPTRCMLTTFMEALRLLCAAVNDSREVIVDASNWGCSAAKAREFKHVWGDHPIKIIHPIDPTTNVARPRTSGPDPNWSALAKEAGKLLNVMKYGTLDDLVNKSTLAGALDELAAMKQIGPLPWKSGSGPSLASERLAGGQRVIWQPPELEGYGASTGGHPSEGNRWETAVAGGRTSESNGWGAALPAVAAAGAAVGAFFMIRRAFRPRPDGSS